MKLTALSKAIGAFVGGVAGWGVSQYGADVQVPQEAANLVGMILPVLTTYFAPKNRD